MPYVDFEYVENKDENTVVVCDCGGNTHHLPSFMVESVLYSEKLSDLEPGEKICIYLSRQFCEHKGIET